jgi:hypothetical protein
MESMAPAMGAVVGVSLCALAGYAISTATAPDTVPSELAQNAGWLVLPLSLFYLTMSGAMKAEEAVDWACVITGDAEEVCGAASFDSSSDMVCVEDYSSGKLRWVCS